MAQQQLPKKKKIKVTEVVNGIERVVEKEVVDTGGDWGPRNAHTLLNTKLERLDGPVKVTGKAKYAHDMRVEGMLYGRILHSKYASAEVVKIDTSAAEKMAGVKAVLVLVEKQLKYEGDPVAAVAATTPEIAEDALRAIKVEYKRLPHAVTHQQAMRPDSPEVMKGGGKGNIRASGTKGDANQVKAALGKCDATADGEFFTPFQHHVCLETHGATVDYRGGDEATIYASSQWTHSISEDAAKTLGLKNKDSVTTIVEYMGGGFGSKFGLDLPMTIACKLSKKASAPVKLMLTRAGEFLAAGNRSGALIKVRAGANKDGELIACYAEQFRLGGLDGGSQADLPYIYNAKEVYRSTANIHTHQDGSVAMRAPGHVQASFAMESIMDMLAYKIGMDPVAFRKKNTTDLNYHRQLDTGAKAIGWENRPQKPGEGPLTGPFKSLRRGMGCAMATWGGGGFPSCQVDVFIQPDGGIAVQVGTQDLGTGTRTYMAAIVAEEFGLPLKSIEVRIGSSKYGMSNPSGGSTTVGSLAPAVKEAVSNARLAFVSRLAPALGAKAEEIGIKGGRFTAKNGKAFTWKQACASLGRSGIAARGEWNANLQGSGLHGVNFAEVEVDIETGKVSVLKMVGVQDCGLPLNRTGVESQINGGMIQALGFALTENHTADPILGIMLNPSLDDYKLPGCFEMPEMIPIIDDGDERNVVIGMAEPAVIPGAGAIANAVFSACGVRVKSVPITPEKILRGLERLKRS